MIETHFRKGTQTLKLGVAKVMHDLFPNEAFKNSYSIGEGVFGNLVGSMLSVREVKQIEMRLREWVEQDSPIQFIESKDGYYHYQLSDMRVKIIYPAHTTTSLANQFTITPFSYGFIIDFSEANIKSNKPIEPPFLLASTYEWSQHWLNQVGIEFFSDINNYITSGRSLQLLDLAEAVQEKTISDIADLIIKQRRALRVLLIAGPSSSGKTCFAQRIATQLQVLGMKTVSLSLNDYYLSRDQMPRDADGKYNFDCLEALDIPLLQQHLEQLIAGETVEVPVYDFIHGRRTKQPETMHVGPAEILVVEGMHALNPSLVPDINRNLLFKVYVSALGGLNFDLINRMPTTEVRLLRRLVKDDWYRGSHPETTLSLWASVRRGEEENIFRFQEEADVMFNSNILYEMNVLRPFAESILSKISDDSPFRDTKERLMNLLTFFEPMDYAKVPFNSILREFIGGGLYFSR